MRLTVGDNWINLWTVCVVSPNQRFLNWVSVELLSWLNWSL